MAAVPDLPVLKFEPEIVSAVAENPVVVIIGETGSGKSTQLSQILHRHGYTRKANIAVTQPRRVAAVSVSRRVAQELGVRIGEEVGYVIRFEDRTSEKTCIKYLTDGCLLRESLSDPELNQYSVVILDEAHERSLNTDILLGLMKHLVKTRMNLKVLITSATLDGVKVSKFFSDCPILNVPGTLYPVEILYNTERPKSYLESSLQKVIDIHVREPPGDILVFMTGQDDIEKMMSKLEERIKKLEEGSCLEAVVLPLHGSLPPEMQGRVFSPAPPNCRRIIVATNIAETSLTVDGVVYVVDPGYVKQRQYNPSTGMFSLDVVQISRVQADQRAGRAGRTRPGKCYRLYPSTVYREEFLHATIPEILRSSLAGSVLYLKSLSLPDIDVLKFDFLDPPSRESLEDALRHLYLVDAIDKNGLITQIGRTMAELPLEPSLARTLIEANKLGCLSQALTIVAMLSSETTLRPVQSKTKERKRKQPILHFPDGSRWGDHIQLLRLYESWEQAGYDPNWCTDNDLQDKIQSTIEDHISLYRQHLLVTFLMIQVRKEVSGYHVRSMLFSKEVRKQLSQIIQKIAKGPVDVRAGIKQRKHESDYQMLRRALCKGYGNQLAERKLLNNGYRTLGDRSQLVQVHPSSVVDVDEDGKLPMYLLYHELMNTSSPFMRNVCRVEREWVLPVLEKFEKMDINRLSGSSGKDEPQESTPMRSPKREASVVEAPDKASDRDLQVQAARERYLARKEKK